MRTMNGFTSELLVKKAKRNWRTRCGAFLLAILAAYCGGNAFGQATLTTQANFPQDTAIDTVQTQNRVAPLGQNIGAPYGYNIDSNGGKTITWQVAQGHNNGLDLSDVVNGNVQAYLLYSPAAPAPAVRAGIYTFLPSATFAANGATFTTSSDVIWTGAFNASGGVYNTQGNNLTIGSNQFSNTTSLTVQYDGAGGSYGGWLMLSGGSNTGTINVGSGGVQVGGNFSNTGTINISDTGVLALQGGYNLGGTVVHGQGYNGNGWGRGIMQLNGGATFSGNWTGEISVSSGLGTGPYGGYQLNARNAAGAGLNTLRIIDGAAVVIDSQLNIGNANIILGGGGTLAKSANVGILTLSNSIKFDDVNIASGEGSIDAWGTVVGWTDNFDYIYDAGNRVILTGNISSQDTRNQTFQINARGGVGAVSIQGTNTYDGAYKINDGTLEIDSGVRLGPHGDPTQSSENVLTIGDAVLGEKANLRVINAGGTTDTITRAVRLENDLSFYEVFTGNIATSTVVAGVDTLADSSRFTVIQTGSVKGTGSLNKAGDGVLVLAASANGYTGDTNVHHGVLQISSINQINDNVNHRIRIGSPDYQSDGARPVFETTLGTNPATRPESGTLSINHSKVEINQVNSVIRTTGKGNETIINTKVTSSPASQEAVSQAPVLNKEGAGILTLNYNGNDWGYHGAGELNIRQGTVQFSSKDNLAGGDITIGGTVGNASMKDVDLSVPYEAILKLADGVGSQMLPNNVILGNATNTYIDVGIGSNLGVNQVRNAVGVNADLNKRGEGTLTLQGNSAYTGWTNIEQGTVVLTRTDQIVSSKGVDLIGENTVLDMRQASQTLNGLRGGIDGAAGDPRDFLTDIDDPAYWTRKVLIGDQNLTLDIQNNKPDGSTARSVFRGNIVSEGGTVTKKNSTTFAAGFVGFDGTFDIQGGTLQTLSDTTITGIAGKAGTFLDVLGNTLTIDIDTNQKYNGTIISSSPVSTPYAANAVRPLIIKDGIGTLTAGFYSDPALTGIGSGFRGDLTLKEGNIVSTTDFRMADGGTLTYYANMDSSGNVVPLKLTVGENASKAAVFGNDVKVKVEINDEATGWQAPKGNLTVGIIEGNTNSSYDGMVADSANSLFHVLQLNQINGTGRKDLHIDIGIKGFSGVGNTYNTIAVGENLDNIRLLDLHGNNLENVLRDIWAAGSHITSDADRENKLGIIRNLYKQLAGETLANAMFMGLDRPWQRPFEHLNLDSQMVYLTPPGVSGPDGQRPIANMRNLWFTPTVQSISARSDDNARKFGIERSGFQIGFDKRVAQNTSLGFVLGQSSPNLRTDDDRVEGNDFQFGLYGGTMVGYYVEMKGFIGFGHQTFKSNRSVYFPNDLIVPDSTAAGGYRAVGGVQRSMTAHGRFDGDTFNFSFEVARPLFLGFAILRPTIGLDSEHAFRYAFTETGDAVAMKFDRESLSRTRMRLGMGMESCTFDRAIFKGYLGYSTLLGGRDYANATGQFVNVYASKQTVRSVAVGKSYFDAGVGTKIFLNPSKTLSLDANYNASVANRWSEHLGDVGFIYVF